MKLLRRWVPLLVAGDECRAQSTTTSSSSMQMMVGVLRIHLTPPSLKGRVSYGHGNKCRCSLPFEKNHAACITCSAFRLIRRYVVCESSVTSTARHACCQIPGSTVSTCCTLLAIYKVCSVCRLFVANPSAFCVLPAIAWLWPRVGSGAV